MFKPREASNMVVPAKLLKRVVTTVSGAKEISYLDALQNAIFFCNFKTFGGTETVVNGKLVIENTAQVTTWFRPDVKASDRMILLDDMSEWDIISDPENIERRNQFLVFKVKRVTGGA